MPAPSVSVEIAPALIANGSLTATNSAIVGYAAPDGPSGPLTVVSAPDAAAAGVPDATVQHLADLFAQGVPQVILARTTAGTTGPVDPATIDADGWGEAFEQVDAVNYALGNALLPGVGTAAAHEALVRFSQDTRRAAFLDAPLQAATDDVLDLAAAQAGSPDTYLTGLFADWCEVRAGGSATRALPGSIAAAGATARMDVLAGHANRMPAGPQDTGTAGLVFGGIDVIAPESGARTNAQLDALADAGVNTWRRIPQGVFLWDYLSITDDELWTNLTSAQGVAHPRSQLNFGRLAMQILGDANSGLRQFLFQQNNGTGQLLTRAENYLGQYLAGLWNAGAIFGATPDDAYAVRVNGVTTEADTAAGLLRAAISFAPSTAIRHVVLQATVNRAGS